MKSTRFGRTGERIVERLVPDVVLGRLAPDRVGEDVGQRLHEIAVRGHEFTRHGGLHPEHAPRSVAAADRDREPALRPRRVQNRAALAVLLGVPIVDDDRPPGTERHPGLGAIRHADAKVVDRLGQAAEARPQEQPLAAGRQLQDRPVLRLQDLGGVGDGGIHQLGQVRAGERQLADSRDRGLLRRAALQLGFGPLALGDVRQHAVPPHPALFVGHQHGVVANPDRPAVAIGQAVVLRRRLAALAQRSGLAREHARAVVRVQQPRPQLRIGEPLLGRKPEQGVHLRADVVPAAADAGIGDVGDRREALHEGEGVDPRQSRALVPALIARRLRMGAHFQTRYRHRGVGS